jgi:regulator of protease activity HflC (stomatin/prohibitin superfamily)
MFGFKRFAIGQSERVMLYRDRRLEAILGPGVHRYFDPLGRLAGQAFDLNRVECEAAGADLLLRTAPEVCAPHLQLADVGERQVGLLYLDGKLSGLLPPASRRVYWRGPVAVRVELTEIGDDLRVPKAVLELLARSRATPAIAKALAAGVQLAEVKAQQVGLLFVDGEFRGTLPAGLHGFWGFLHTIKVEILELRVQALEVSGQEILTKDKVSLRINLSAGFRINDPVKARTELDDWSAFLYRELQFGLRQAIGGRTLEELLGEKESLDRSLLEQVQAKAAPFGLEVREVGIKDVILPGEMKAILNQVVEAEKAAQANGIKRREETAATRSLLNTAKLMEENPLLLRLKELETLEKVTDRIGSLTVFGGLEGVLNGLVRIGQPQG